MSGGRLLKIAPVLICASALAVFLSRAGADALQISQRSVQIASAVPSVVTSHSFQFFMPSTSTVGSIVLQYCSNSPLFDQACTAPAGLNVSGASLTGQSGNIGFTIDNADTTASKLVLTRTAANGSAVTSSYNFGNITNPSAAGSSTFVRISTYASTNGSGGFTDNGSVAFATESVFNIGASVPPFLKLCVGISVSPSCTSLSGDRINFGNLSPNRASAAKSQFATATNSASGYAVYTLGTTMTSGNNVIRALNAPTTNFPGSPQFGLNLRANLSPVVGSDPVGLGSAAPTTDYNIPNRFTFSDGDSVAQSSLPTDYNRMTVSYLVNVPANQPSGVYSTTITYLAVAQF